MILTTLMYIGFALLALKATWNLAVPFRLLLRPYRDKNGATNSISLGIIIDAVLLCWTLLLIPFATDDYLIFRKLSLAVLCVAFPVGSLVLCLVMGFFLGWAKAKFFGKQPDGRTPMD